MDALYIVIPAYNEEANIEAVAREWHEVVRRTGPDSRLVIVDDGSRDGTLSILEGLRDELPQLLPLTKPNAGHGPTLLFGYRYALDHGADYVFQTDSDGQTIPDEFWPFWEARHDYDWQTGFRRHRQDGLSRVMVTKTLRLVVFLSFGVWVTDANTPFRLMTASSLAPHLALVPEGYNLTNVLLSVLYKKSGQSGRLECSATACCTCATSAGLFTSRSTRRMASAVAGSGDHPPWLILRSFLLLCVFCLMFLCESENFS